MAVTINICTGKLCIKSYRQMCIRDRTYREDVLQYAMDHLDVSERIGTAAYQNFDVQVFYSTLIDLRGGAPL